MPGHNLGDGNNLKIEWGDGLTVEERDREQALLDRTPNHVRARLFESGTRIFVGTRADETPGWPEHAKATGVKPTDKIADGREVGTLSFYLGSRNEVFISVHNPGGSVNVYVHELSHAVDYQWTGDGKLISNDPEWVQLHNENIKDNPLIRPYYRGGPSGTNPASGRKELFAEGFARYNEYGRDALARWVRSGEVADKMIEIWKRYGVVR